MLMIVMTTLAGGDLSAAFVGTETLPECRERLERVRLIINDGAAKGGPRIAGSGCFTSAERFSDFSHGQSNDEPIQHYRIVLSGENAAVIRHDGAEACRRAIAAAPAAGEQHCAQSRQTLRENAR
ncbi:hypothetical protein [Bosea sp. (in: a-proteobacteria)]|uniref:hypothetical protein n=1 Tax=Bosea sp. (in: a-proteobacteria) TaxID=1871050 RepID=UPI0026147CED|nr:hypothetical protein [Bosea sp. (in: a-proteobacteria)]MCO5091356.1 hypothetical protein [Bosea sp. (in: a-proteobacteria)]